MTNENAQLKYPYTSLDYVEDLVKAGFNEKQSKAQAKALFRVIEQNAVTKQDLKELEGKIAYDIKELDVKMKELEVKLSHDIQNVQRDIKEMESRLTVKLSTIVGGMLTLAITAIGFLVKVLH